MQLAASRISTRWIIGADDKARGCGVERDRDEAYAAALATSHLRHGAVVSYVDTLGRVLAAM